MQRVKERKRNRIQGYDYSTAGYYFITICTHNRVKWFGDIVEGQTRLNGVRAIVQEQWKWLSGRYSYVKLDQYVVMPNHIHGILIIDVGNGRDRSLHTYKICRKREYPYG